MANIIEITVTAKNLAKATFDEIAKQGRSIGQQTGDEFTKGVGDEVEKKLPPELEKPLEDSGGKGGKKAGQAAAKSMSPLLIGAFAAAGTVGPGLLLAGTAAAVIGVGALITKSNVQLTGSYQKLAADASTAVQDAAAPLIPELQASLVILDQGVGKVGDQLHSAFAAAAPEATAITSGFLGLADNALPGVVDALKAAQPYAHEIATDLGELGSGIGGLFSGLAGGASGGMQGLSSLIDVASHLLADVGQITGAVSQGLGPALHDLDVVAVPAAHALTEVVQAVPPGVIRAAADSVALLYGAFKLGSLAGVLKEGATFGQFLGGTSVTAAKTEGALKSLAAKGVGGLSGALSLATGPLGMIIAGAGIAGSELGKAFSHDITVNADALALAMQNAAQGLPGAQEQVTGLAQALNAVPWGKGAAGFASIDDALTKLQANDPAAASLQYYQLQAALEASGKSAGDVAKMFPQYTSALDDAKLAAGATVQTSNELADALSKDATAASASAQQTAAQALSTLGARDGNDRLTIALNSTIQAFETASSQASAYKLALDASFNKYGDYSAAQAAFTTDLDTASKSLTAGKDAINLHSAAGAANFTVLKQLSDANEQVAETLLTQTGSQNQANRALQAGALQIDGLAKSAHFSQGQIDALNVALYGTKNIGDITVKVAADTSAATKGVVGLLHWIDDQSANVGVYASPRGASGTGRATAAFAHGGIRGMAASGGPRGNLTWVGEHGMELVDLPPGTRVHSNPDSMRMAAESGSRGSAQPVQLEWVGGNAGDEFMAWLRKNIRIRGGNVQTVLGH